MLLFAQIEHQNLTHHAAGGKLAPWLNTASDDMRLFLHVIER